MIFALVRLRVHFLMIFNSFAFNRLVRDLCENLIKAMGLLLKDEAKHTQNQKPYAILPTVPVAL